MKDFPLPTGPMAWIIFALVLCLFAFIAYALIRSYSQRKYVERRHEGFDSVVDRLRKEGQA